MPCSIRSKFWIYYSSGELQKFLADLKKTTSKSPADYLGLHTNSRFSYRRFCHEGPTKIRWRSLEETEKKQQKVSCESLETTFCVSFATISPLHCFILPITYYFRYKNK